MIALAILLAPSLCQADAVGVLISREIPPYISMLESLERQLGNRSIDRFFLDSQNQPYSLGGKGTLNPEEYDVLVAVGPRALRYLQPRAKEVPLVFGMVLNPQHILTEPEMLVCGVSLNIPIESQFSAILQRFSGMTQLGILFDPANNQEWYEKASQVADTIGLELVPLQVQRESGRLTLLGDFSLPDAILFIPDKTIISKAVVQYVIKQAVLKGTPTVGYNQFFYDSGAALSFLIDYTKVGQQVAGQVEAVLTGGPCKPLIPPAFDVRINEGVWQALQLENKEGGL